MAGTRPRSSPRGAKLARGGSNDEDIYVEVRVPMSEVELDLIIARSKKHGVAADEYVAREIRGYLAKQPQMSLLSWELKLVRSVSGRRQAR